MVGAFVVAIVGNGERVARIHFERTDGRSLKDMQLLGWASMGEWPG